MRESIRSRIFGPLPYLWLGMVALLTLVGAPPLIITTIREGPDSPGSLFALLWLGALAWFWYVSLVWISYEIRLSPTGILEFRSVLRRVKMDARQLTYIGPAMGGFDPYTVVFKSTTATARALRSMDNFSLLIQELCQLSPGVRMRGV